MAYREREGGRGGVWGGRDTKRERERARARESESEREREAGDILAF